MRPAVVQDYTLFEPANTAYALTDPTKWQPLVIEPVLPYGGGGQGATGAPYVQHHITPHVSPNSPETSEQQTTLPLEGAVIGLYELSQ